MNDVNVYPGRQKERGVPNWKNNLEAFSCSLLYEICSRAPLSTKVEIGVIHVVSASRPSPSIFHFFQGLDGGKAWKQG